MTDQRGPRGIGVNYECPDVASEPLIAALAASNVGTWEWTVAQDHVIACAATASLFGIAPAEALEGLPLDRYIAAVHADDRDRTRSSIMQVRRNGGLFVAEYRTVPAPDDVRWVLARGRFELDAAGQPARARGIVIDVSESRQEGVIEGHPFVAYEMSEGSLTDQLTARAVEMHRLLHKAEARHRRRVKPILDLLLLVLGQQLGASMPGQDSWPTRDFH